MEEVQNPETQTQATPQETETNSSNGVSFPTVNDKKKSGGSKTLLIIAVLILVGILGFVIYKSASNKNDEAMTEPTPYENMASPLPEEAMEASPVASATPSTAEKGEIKIQVQNGTGIAGEAAYLQTQLKDLGYTDIAVGNAANQDLTATQVSFASTVPSSVVTEITNELKSIYQSVTTITATSTTYDVVVITGLKKGATPNPAATPQATPEATATPSPTPTATP